MKVYRNPFVSRESYFVKTGAAKTGRAEASASKGFSIEFINGEWEVREATYYDFSLRDEMPVVAENRVSIKNVIHNAVRDAVLGLVDESNSMQKGDFVSREAVIEAFEDIDNDVCVSRPNVHCDWGEIREVIRDIISKIPTAETAPVQRWISCKNRPPKECGRYQAVVESEAFPGDSYIDTLTYDKFGWRDGCCYVNGVSHWMPLPKLPTRKDDDGKGE